MKTNVASTTKLLPDRVRSGTLLPPLEQAVAVRSTPTGLPCSRETVIVLTAFLYSLFGYTLSSDVMFLATLQAKTEALKMGVSEKQFEQIRKTVLANWLKNRNNNPLSCMF